MADPPSEGSEQAGPERPGTTPRDRFERGLSMARIVVVVPVLVLLLGAVASFAYGTEVFVRSVVAIVKDPELTSHNIGFLLLLSDLFLVGATLMIAGFGLYDLFITKGHPDGRTLPLPAWLRMTDLNDLKGRIISMLVMVLTVSFVDQAVVLENKIDTLYLGGAVALVIGALTLFIRYGL